MITNDVFLIGDIGGTHSNFEVIEFKDGRFFTIYKKNIETLSIKNFVKEINIILSEIVSKNRVIVENCVLACAGFISNGKVKLTNSDIIIDSDKLIENTSLKKIDLINDLIAISYSISTLKEDNFKRIVDKQKGGKKIVIGVGTGFNISYIDSFEIISSEVGHTIFTISDRFDFKLVTYLKKRLGKQRIEVEDILSGRGLENIYKYLFFARKKKNLPSNLTADEISKSKSKNIIAKETLDLFYIYLSRIARDLSLIFLPDEVYFAGGVIQRNIFFNKSKFKNEFYNDENFSSYLKNISLTIVKDYSSSIEGIKNYITKNK